MGTTRREDFGQHYSKTLLELITINKRALVHLESLLDMEKIKSKENQELYHNNEKAYLIKLSAMEKETVVKEKLINDLK